MPNESSHRLLLGDLAYLIYALQIGAQTTVHAEHTPIYDCTQSKIVKHLTAPTPHIAASIFPLTFVIKPINLCNLPRFMVAPYEGDALRVSDFQGQQQEKRFDAVETPINEVAC